MAVYSSDDDLLTKALKLLSEDQKAQQSQSNFEILQQAGEELGIPKSYLLKARTQLESEKKNVRRKRMLSIFSVLFVLFIGLPVLGLLIESDPWSDNFENKVNWELSAHPQTVASYEHIPDTDRKGYARINVESLHPDAQGQFEISLSNSQVPDMLISHHDITFTARATGLLKVIVGFEGTNGQWSRSKPIQLTPNWYTYKILLSDFENGTRTLGLWKPLSSPVDTAIQRIHFIINEKTTLPGIKGHLDLDRVSLDVLRLN